MSKSKPPKLGPALQGNQIPHEIGEILLRHSRLQTFRHERELAVATILDVRFGNLMIPAGGVAQRQPVVRLSFHQPLERLLVLRLHFDALVAFTNRFARKKNALGQLGSSKLCPSRSQVGANDAAFTRDPVALDASDAAEVAENPSSARRV